MLPKDTPEFNPLDDIGTIRVEDIDVEAQDRLREVDAVWADALGLAMLREGQATPIVVCKLPGRSRWTLVAGAHRVAGATKHGIEHLRAEIISPRTHERAQREVSENLWRRGLDPVERAAFVAKLVSLKRVQAGEGETKRREGSVADRWKQQIATDSDEAWKSISTVYGFSDEVGAELGMTGRMIRNELLLFRRLPPSLVARLRSVRHSVLSNATQLRALAKLGPDDQDTVVTLLLRDRPDKPAVKTVAAAIAQMRGSNRPSDPAGKRLNAVLGSISRMSAPERVALFQSPQFHDLLPAEAKLLLAPMCRDGLEKTDVVEYPAADQDRKTTGLPGYGRAPADRGDDAIGQRRDRGDVDENEPVQHSAMGLGSRVLGGAAEAAEQRPQLIALIGERLSEGLDADFIIADLSRYGGRARFVHGTFELKLARVTATCTAGGSGLLKAWMNAAQRHDEQMAALGLNGRQAA